MDYIILLIVIVIILLSLYLLNISNISKDTFQNNELKKVFDTIYDNKIWTAEGNGSGSGSEPYNTINTIKVLVKIIMDNNIKVMIDSPCGSCKWTRLLLEELKKNNIKIKYYGFDIADEPIANANKELESLKSYHDIELKFGDLTNMTFPKADLLLCRDVLQHLSYDNIFKIINNFSKADVKMFLLGAYISCDNRNIADGEYFPINLAIEPFNMIPEALYYDSPDGNKYLFQYSKINPIDIQTQLINLNI